MKDKRTAYQKRKDRLCKKLWARKSRAKARIEYKKYKTSYSGSEPRLIFRNFYVQYTRKIKEARRESKSQKV